MASVARAAALVVLVCIGFDVIGDANCDPLVVAPGQTSVGARSNDGETCQTVCVPDCFCCSRAISDVLAINIALAGPVVVRDSVTFDDQLDGVLTAVFHPPLLRA